MIFEMPFCTTTAFVLIVKKAREAVSDSVTLHEIALLGAERIKNLQCAFRSFNNNDFMDKLVIIFYSLSADIKRRDNLICLLDLFLVTIAY